MDFGLGDVAVSAAAIEDGDATVGPTVCTVVTMNNTSDETVDFNIFDWKLQTPSGTITSAGPFGSHSMLSSDQIAPGGTATGDVCFDADGSVAGQYVVLYEPIFSFFSDRAAWINNR